MTVVLCIGVLAILAIMVFQLWLVFNYNRINQRDEIKEEPKPLPPFDRSRVLLEIDNPLEKINNLIDAIIKDAIDMYNIQNPSLDKEYQYIKMDEIDNAIVPYVYITAMKSMTPDVVSIISLMYSFEPFDMDKFLAGLTTDNYIPSDTDTNTLEWLIYTRTKLAVINFVTNINS